MNACNSNTEAENSKIKVVNKTAVKSGIATSEFTVWGNCGMCKETIEKSVNKEGVVKYNWNTDTKIMTISYDTAKISLQTIQQSIADAGYDNVKFKGNDAAYSKLHECCKYERK
jgi:copper chaperone CopZ